MKYKVLIAFFVFPLLTYAQEVPKEELVAEFMVRSGISRRCDAVWPSFMAGAMHLNKSRKEEFVKLFKQPLQPEALERGAARLLLSKFNREKFKTANAWLGTSLISKLIDLDINSLSAIGKEEYVTFLATIPQTQTAKRRELILRLDRGLNRKKAEWQALVLRNRALNWASGLSTKFSDSSFGQFMQYHRSKFETRTLDTLTFSFRDVSDADLEAFVTDLETPIGQWIVKMMYQSLLDATADAIAPFEVH